MKRRKRTEKKSVLHSTYTETEGEHTISPERYWEEFIQKKSNKLLKYKKKKLEQLEAKKERETLKNRHLVDKYLEFNSRIVSAEKRRNNFKSLKHEKYKENWEEEKLRSEKSKLKRTHLIEENKRQKSMRIVEKEIELEKRLVEIEVSERNKMIDRRLNTLRKARNASQRRAKIKKQKSQRQKEIDIAQEQRRLSAERKRNLLLQEKQLAYQSNGQKYQDRRTQAYKRKVQIDRRINSARKSRIGKQIIFKMDRLTNFRREGC